MLNPWTLLLLAASIEPGAPAVALGVPAAPPGAHCVLGVRPRAWRPAQMTGSLSAGMRIDLDPEAAQQTSLEFEAMSQAEHESAFDALRAEPQADGSLVLVVGDLLQSYSVVRIDADGQPRIDCAHSAPEAARLSRRPLPARKWEVK